MNGVVVEASWRDYLVKPFSARELLARVDAILKIARVPGETTEILRQSEERYRFYHRQLRVSPRI